MAEQLTLSDGRILDFFLSGDPDGFPLFYIHGTPGCYIPPVGFPVACQKAGIKCVTMSRAGYGGSTRKKGRKVVDDVDDVKELKKHLGIEECFAAGWSGGGKFLGHFPYHTSGAMIDRNTKDLLF